MSLATTLARARFRAADATWREHRAHCATCSVAAGRDGGAPCRRGEAARRARVAAQVELDAERALDRAPAPGQGTLW